MHITYDPQADAMYIRFNDNRPVVGRPVNDIVIVHLDEDRRPVGIELLTVSTFFKDADALTRYPHPLEDEANVR